MSRIYQGFTHSGLEVCLFHDTVKHEYVVTRNMPGSVRLIIEVLADSLGMGDAYRAYNHAFR